MVKAVAGGWTRNGTSRNEGRYGIPSLSFKIVLPGKEWRIGAISKSIGTNWKKRGISNPSGLPLLLLVDLSTSKF